MIAQILNPRRVAARICRARSILALLAGVSVVVTACERVSGRDVFALVFSADGSVAVGRTNKTDFRPVKAVTRFSAGDKIRTGEDGTLRICFLPGIVGQVGARSDLSLLDLMVKKDGNALTDAMRARVVRIRVNSGLVDISLSEKGPAHLEAETPMGVLSADSGSLFRMRMEGKTMRVLCMRGLVHLKTQAGNTETIAAGYFREWPSERLEPVAVDSDANAQNDVVEALTLERELLALQDREQHAFAPWLRR